MINICTVILFILLSINIPVLIAYLKGLQFQINNPECKEEVNDVMNNIKATKIVQLINVILQSILMVFFILLS